MAFCTGTWFVRAFFGAVIIRIPSELRLEATSFGLQSAGRVHFLENCLMTWEDPEAVELAVFFSSDFWSSCLPSIARVLLTVVTFNSSGRYSETSKVTSNFVSSSFTFMTYNLTKRYKSIEDNRKTSTGGNNGPVSMV